MKNIYFVANFKSNKIQEEAENWFTEFSENYSNSAHCIVIICPSFTALPRLKELFEEKNSELKLGGQNVSSFSPGPFTGEVNAVQLKEFVSYCIVGHSERRSNFSEDHSNINKKISLLLESKITPILCVSDLSELSGVEVFDGLIAYEPIEEIGSGHPQDLESAQVIYDKIKNLGFERVLYGGGIGKEDSLAFVRVFDGVMVGSESLNPRNFLDIIKNAS